MIKTEEHGLMASGKREATLASKILYMVSLSVSTLVLIAVYITSGLSASNDATKFGFKNKTGDVSDDFYTQITPAGWAFSIWGIIYVWQAVWILYGWSVAVRYRFPVTITPIALIFYTLTNIGNVTWIYVWGNAYPQYSFPILILVGVCLYLAIGAESLFLYKQTVLLENLQKFRIDLYLVRIVVLNGLSIYAAWVSIATLINFTIVLEYFADMSPEDAGTVGLSLLTLEVLVYFVLENTVLDFAVRPIFMVYPVVIWALSAVISAHWGNEGDGRTNTFTLVLLVLSIILFVIRVVLMVVFAFKRPINYPSKMYV